MTFKIPLSPPEQNARLKVNNPPQPKPSPPRPSEPEPRAWVVWHRYFQASFRNSPEPSRQ